MLEELCELIDLIQSEYIKITNKWKTESINLYNFSNVEVRYIESTHLLEYAFEYITFLNDNIIDFEMSLKDWDKNNSKVNARVKARNSIVYKINNYNTSRHQYGKVPVKKCLNDLFGIRIILDGNYSFEEISEQVILRFPTLKCILSEKEEYKATHIYFKIPKDNSIFQWELQVWLKEDELTNIESHRKYKQDYIFWESNLKEGV